MIYFKHMNKTLKKISLLGILSIFTLSAVTQPVFADDIPFFSSNDVLYYSEKGCTVQNQSGDIAVVGNDNAEKIFKFLTSASFKGTGDKPFNAVQAAGALGNFQQESGMDPGAIEGGAPNSYPGDGHGLAQWSYNVSGGARVSEGRRGILFELAKSEGKEWSDLSLQLKMIQNELNDVGSTEGSRLLNDFPEFATVSDPAKASYLFMQSYERAGTPVQEKRDSAAKAYYEKFKNLAPDPASTSASTSGGACTGGGSGLTAFMGSDFTIYNQCQYPPYGGSWGTTLNTLGQTACSTACGPTSLAMAVKNMTGQNITPKETIEYYNQQKLWKEGGSWVEGLNSGADHWGLRTESFDTKDINAYKSVFDKGGLVIVAGYGASPFMSQGHYILIRGITDEGKFRIGDPGQGVNTNGTPEKPLDWDTAPIVSNSVAAGSVAIYKK